LQNTNLEKGTFTNRRLFCKVKSQNREIKQDFDTLHSKALRRENTNKKYLKQLTFLKRSIEIAQNAKMPVTRLSSTMI